MRLTVCRNRWLRAALLAAWVIAAGCQRLPYIDQSKPVPHDNLGRVALEDKEVKQADLLSSSLPMQLPKVAKPRTTNDPEAQEVWPMTLQQAIRIGLDNSEVVRVIAFGAQGIPIGGFEPTPLNTGASAGVASSLGCRHPADRSTIRRSSRPRSPRPCRPSTPPSRPACSGATTFSRSTTAFRAARSTSTGTKFPIVSVNDSATFQMGLSKQTETGATARRRPQRQLVLPEQLVPGLAVGLHHQHPAHLDPALAG